MNQVGVIAVQYILVPALQGVASWAINQLRKSKDGIPKRLILTVVDAIAGDQTNSVTNEDIDIIKEKVGA